MNIKNSAVKARDFVLAHPKEIALFTAGFAAGAVIANANHHKFRTGYVDFVASKTNLKKLEKDGGAIVFSPYHGHEYCLINSPF